jgi:hypothetical protein
MNARRNADPITQQIGLAETLLMLRMAASKMHELIKIRDKDESYRRIIQKSCPAFNDDKREVRKISCQAHCLQAGSATTSVSTMKRKIYVP